MGAIATLGSILPILGGITSTVTALDRTFQLIGDMSEDSQKRQQELQMRQLKQQQRLQEQQLAENYAQQRGTAALEGALDAEKRRASIKRAVSRQRAQFGSSGIANSGSAEAVLLGMFDETEDEIARREQIDSMRNRALELDEAQNRSLNLLQATQLAQRQRLENL
jgi:hypothetical protein